MYVHGDEGGGRGAGKLLAPLVPAQTFQKEYAIHNLQNYARLGFTLTCLWPTLALDYTIVMKEWGECFFGMYYDDFRMKPIYPFECALQRRNK